MWSKRKLTEYVINKTPIEYVIHRTLTESVTQRKLNSPSLWPILTEFATHRMLTHGVRDQSRIIMKGYASVGGFLGNVICTLP